MRTKYDALQIANEIILTAKENHQNITNLQLQKILYYIQGNFMRVFGYKAFNEKILCWDYGPVIEDVWHKYNIYGRSPLSPDNNEHICSKQEINLITDVVSEKLALNVWKMVDDIHLFADLINDLFANVINKHYEEKQEIKQETNFEYFKEEITKLDFSFAVRNGKVVPCEDCPCKECYFKRDVAGCNKFKIKWLYGQYEKKYKLNQFE